MRSTRRPLVPRLARPFPLLLALVVAVALASSAAEAQRREVDLLIRGGTVIDGTGAPGRRADVGVRGDRIVFVGLASAATVRAARTLDATGLVVAPGFIDPHTHSQDDLSSAMGRTNLPWLMQGVTTVLSNNDGHGTESVGPSLAAWEHDGIGTNVGLYIGHGNVRRQVMGMSDAAPTAAQLDSMRALVAVAMREGALGLSTGLYYAPGSWSRTDEVIALAKVAAQHGGRYDSHLRDESSYTVGLLGAVDEAIRIAREANIPVHIAHVKALGTEVWGLSDSVVARMRAARAAGLRVTADQYPYLASGTSVGASLLPRWAEAGGRDSLRVRTADPATRARLVTDMQRNMARRNGPAALLITGGRDSTIRGRTLAQVAEARGLPPIEAAIQIILAGDASVASFNMKESDVATFMVQPFVVTGSDGSGGHPRKYGSFPRKLRLYVFEQKLLTLPQAIRQSSGRTAELLGIRDRGVLAVGRYADVIVFDTATVADRATYEAPTELAVGMRWVLVNGRIAVEDGRPTGALAGRALRRPGTPPRR